MHTRIHLWILLLSGTLATLLCVWACYEHGIGLTDDSGWYSFSAHYGITETFFNDSLTTFPPLYPLLLSLYKITPFSFYTFSVLLNLIAYWFILLAWYKISGVNFSEPLFRIFFIIVTALSTPLLVNVYMLWSESIFIALLSWNIYFFIKYLEAKNVKHVVYSSLLITLAFYDRYAAILVFPVYAVFFIAEKKIKHLLLFFIPVVLFCGGWLLRNAFLTNKLSGYEAAKMSLSENIQIIADIISVFILPDEIPVMIRWLVLILVLLVLVWKIKSRKNIFVLIFTICYAVVLIVLNSIKDIQFPPDERYLSPVLIPFLFVLFFSLERFYISFSALLKKIMMIIIVLWLMYPVSRSFINAQKAAEYGIGYHDNSWKTIPLIEEINRLKPLPLFSNNPVAIVLLTEKKCLSSSVLGQDTPPEVYLIHWNEQNRLPYIPHSLEDYSKYFTFTEVYSSPEGKIYKAIRILWDR